MRALEGQLEATRYGAAVRLEVSHECPQDLRQFLLDHFSLQEDDMYLVDGPVNLNRLSTVCDLDGHPELLYKPFAQGLPEELQVRGQYLLAVVEQERIAAPPLPVVRAGHRLYRHAAADADVLAIKLTLYRTGANSPIVDHLVTAARAGKEVTVIIELMARFDEAANISLANRLQEAGAHVVYGVVGYKTHAKMTLVVRREGGKLRRYVHLGTGNYHHSTTRVYTDYGYMSSSQLLGEDVHKMFMQLTSLTKPRTSTG